MTPVAVHGQKSASEAGLRYVTDARPGISRKQTKSGQFVYRRHDGLPVKDKETLARIRGLVIPPAWTEVWICPIANGHLQATGRDARGRKQYRYHPRWRETRDQTRFDKLLSFGKALPRIRKRVDSDLRRHGLCRERVLALVVKLLESTLIRVGNDEYARHNGSYGLTTMHNRHAAVSGGKITFTFRGKSGRQHRIDLRSPRMAKLVRRCQELPGQELFGYLDDGGTVHDVTSQDVNDYLRETAGEEFSAKDVRTWAGTVLAAKALSELGAAATQREAKKQVVSAVQATAQLLGNTPAVCRRCYIHPQVIDRYMTGEVMSFVKTGKGGLRAEEAALMRFLRKQ